MYLAHIYKQNTSIYEFTSKVICGLYLVSACMCIYVYVSPICVCMCKMYISTHICLYVWDCARNYVGLIMGLDMNAYKL